MNPTHKIKFSLRKVQTEQFAVIEENYEHNTRVNFTFAFDFQIIHSQKIIVLSLRFAFAQNNPFLVGKITAYFAVADEEWIKFSNQNQVIIPRLFMIHLAMITVGTARGILHTKTEGTYFNHFLLPLINVMDSIKEDISFNLI